MPATTTPDYCPFCGARLRNDADAYGAHLARREDCRERAEAWAREERGPAVPWTGREEGSAAARMALGLVTALAVLVYAVLIAGQLLLGIFGAVVVLLAFQYGPELV